jgi:hypothetical protein
MNLNVIMDKICVQRKIEVWIEEIYKVEEINDENIDKAIDYNLDPDDSEVLWETQVDLGPVRVFNHNNEILKEYD